MKDFDGKTAFVTGGTSGVGLSLARLLVDRGANVAVFARKAEGLEQTARELAKRRRDGRRAAARFMDVGDWPSVEEACREAASEIGPPDLAVNCAGRARPHYFEAVTPEMFDRTMRVNLYGAYHLARAVTPMMKGQGGYLVNVASVAGLMGVFGLTDYCASKFGVIGFSEALRAELKPRGIYVSVFCPPDTDTPGFARENETKPAETHAVSGAVKLMHPDRAAAALLKGLSRRRFLIIPGVSAQASCLAKRLAPDLVSYVMDRAVRSCQAGGESSGGS
jgi:NAD(P)-dependent dehydrogenase (short-subunit alcohol dehydrogenase family)